MKKIKSVPERRTGKNRTRSEPWLSYDGLFQNLNLNSKSSCFNIYRSLVSHMYHLKADNHIFLKTKI